LYPASTESNREQVKYALLSGVFASVMISRRKLLRQMAATASTALASPLFPGISHASSRASSGGPKRVIFFLQNQGFDPKTCIPAGMTRSGSLAKAKLPEPIQALEPF
jgi:hypothetical protein